uniref:Secreted protein n=1 Tax=Ascaris lumbricoides TaxID=6252 RepID=A0A0M3IA63_ASCLU
MSLFHHRAFNRFPLIHSYASVCANDQRDSPSSIRCAQLFLWTSLLCDRSLCFTSKSGILAKRLNLNLELWLLPIYHFRLSSLMNNTDACMLANRPLNTHEALKMLSPSSSTLQQHRKRSRVFAI